MVVFRSPLDIVIKDRRGVWWFTAAVAAVCLALTFVVTIVSDYFEGNPPLVIGTVRNFVCGLGIMGTKEISHVPTQRACDT